MSFLLSDLVLYLPVVRPSASCLGWQLEVWSAHGPSRHQAGGRHTSQELLIKFLLTSCWQEPNSWPYLAAREADSPGPTKRQDPRASVEEAKNRHWSQLCLSCKLSFLEGEFLMLVGKMLAKLWENFSGEAVGMES